jgi:hypothetical protein
MPLIIERTPVYIEKRKKTPRKGKAPDRKLARKVVALLNEMLELDHAATVKLIERRVGVNDAMADHPTLQVSAEGRLGLLGVLNGLCGVIQRGKYKGRGLVTAVGQYDPTAIDLFRLTEDLKPTLPRAK